MADVALHPQFLLGLSDQLKRKDGGSADGVVGIALGKFGVETSTVSLFVAVELTESDREDAQALGVKLALLDEIYGNGYLSVVGVYTVGRGDTGKVVEMIKGIAKTPLGLVREFEPALFTVSQYTDTSKGFEFHVAGPTGQPLAWEVRSTSSEDIMLSTFCNAGHAREQLAGIQSISAKCSAMLSLISAARAGEVDMQDSSTRAKVAQAILLARKIHEASGDESVETQAAAAAAAVCVNALNQQLIISRELRARLSAGRKL